jgi:hypothetical protein
MPHPLAMRLPSHDGLNCNVERQFSPPPREGTKSLVEGFGVQIKH